MNTQVFVVCLAQHEEGIKFIYDIDGITALHGNVNCTL